MKGKGVKCPRSEDGIDRDRECDVNFKGTSMAKWSRAPLGAVADLCLTKTRTVESRCLTLPT